MSLHHTREITNMRSAYDHDNASRRTYLSDSESLVSYKESHADSERSYQTAYTQYSNSSARRPPHVHYVSCDHRPSEHARPFFDDQQPQESPRASVETYASTVHSEEDDVQEVMPEYDIPAYTARPYAASAIAATPHDFSDLFPSKRKLLVRHDDSTLDGNMNLRVDTEVCIHKRRCDMTLFHLRMHDLKNREFSLRRYCRDSGREVCHSAIMTQKAALEKRPAFQRSLSNALNSMRPKSDSKTPTLASLKRNDSGYGSMHSMDSHEDERPRSSGNAVRVDEPSSNIVKLEFSNYAQVDVKRVGSKGNKRYEFEYWGAQYAWRRTVRKDRGLKEMSYTLTKSGNDLALAYMTALSLSSQDLREEQQKGGWIHPCSMWIADDKIVSSQKDLADVVLSAGLIALVDDAIRARFCSKTERSFMLPSVEYIGPKRLINEMFSRRDTGNSMQSSRPSSSSQNSRPSTSGVGVAGSRVTSASSRQHSHEY